MPPSLHSSMLEVEHKFHRLAIATLTQSNGTPPWSKIPYNANTWVRRRNSAWEAKIRKGGDMTNSRFEELTDVASIAACIKCITGDRMDFEQEAREVELQVEMEAVTEAQKSRVMAEMDEKTGAFMERYA
ncbi:hypothetical protein B0T14DRAFT_545749 [Immersiella caudata]|uniref:Uncharacterized protein n=1 Tax=Immersiella caudata TaxID=314043 RepID=A0AA40BZS3_9PEZI|nr:hypothetical protein B0T14DRAFT_545749 [Immersiella caudata]